MKGNKNFSEKYSQFFDQIVTDYDGNLNNIYYEDNSSQKNLIKSIYNLLDIQNDDVILDAGCGIGNFIFPISEICKHVYGVDFSPKTISICEDRKLKENRTNVTLISASITNIPLPDNSINKILCYGVLHYLTIADIEKTISEFSRLLKLSGVVIICFLNRNSLYAFTKLLINKTYMKIRRKTINEPPYISYNKLGKLVESKIGNSKIHFSSGFYPVIYPKFFDHFFSRIPWKIGNISFFKKFGLSILIAATKKV